MGIRDVVNQQRVQDGQAPFGGGTIEENQPRMGSMNRGALTQTRQTRQRAPQMNAGLGVEQQLLMMSYLTVGLMAVNVMLLIVLIGRQ